MSTQPTKMNPVTLCTQAPVCAQAGSLRPLTHKSETHTLAYILPFLSPGPEKPPNTSPAAKRNGAGS